MSSSLDVRMRRIYDEPATSDGQRILVDRLWPRGVAKADAHLDHWAKDAAPSNELRRWYGHDEAKAEEFAQRYRHELATEPASAALEDLVERATKGRITLLTATRDPHASHVPVLIAAIRGRGSSATAESQ